MSRIEALKGKEIIFAVVNPLLTQKTSMHVAKLIDVDLNGIWIEAKDVAEYVYERLDVSTLPRTPILFVPFAQIAWIFSAADYPSVSEELWRGDDKKAS